MSTDCPELRDLLRALAGRIDGTVGKLDSQEIGNALYGTRTVYDLIRKESSLQLLNVTYLCMFRVC